MTLTPEQQREMVPAIATWRAGGQVPPCPACGASTLTITDCSARPYREWYKLECACGLDHMLAVAMPTPQSLED